MSEKSFEECMARIEEIDSELSDENIELDKSVALYKEAVDLLESCQKKIEEARTSIEKFREEHVTRDE
ncbi:MAG: exodeoxyribonuclease VII small subunit [Oscillospiraceae bacterium]|jgi:exodeoxyribonuclease VII small subunit